MDVALLLIVLGIPALSLALWAVGNALLCSFFEQKEKLINRLTVDIQKGEANG